MDKILDFILLSEQKSNFRLVESSDLSKEELNRIKLGRLKVVQNLKDCTAAFSLKFQTLVLEGLAYHHAGNCVYINMH